MTMKTALIGYTGFVGSTLLKQHKFDSLYRSTNIADIEQQSFSMVIGAGAPAQKWIANKNPEEDLAKITALINHLKTINAERFILISTVDVFKHPVGVNEQTPIEVDGLHAYGANRRLLEQFVESHFKHHLIVRLPGLVGPGLRKNIIFDLLNDNNTGGVDSRGVFQFYPMVNLWYDIQTALNNNLSLVHLTAQPISVAEIAADGFGIPFINELANAPATYDMQSVYAELFQGSDGYQYSKKETIQAVRAYAQSEPITIKTA